MPDNAVCVECGYIGPFHDFSATKVEEHELPNGERYPRRTIGPICRICFAKSKAAEGAQRPEEGEDD